MAQRIHRGTTSSARPETTISRRDTIKPIPDTPENIARAIMSGPPKKEWRYTKKAASARSRTPRR